MRDSYFRAFNGFHDGGLGGHNNPVKLALWEQNLLWDRKSKQPDVIVSLGTGSKTASDTSKRGRVSRLSELFLPRLLRSFMMLLDGQKTWVELVNSISNHHLSRYHRLNISFVGLEPQLDEVDKMKDIKCDTLRFANSHHQEISQCADNLLAALFFLELDQRPIFSRYHFTCRGHICCRLEAGSRGLLALSVRLRDQQAQFQVKGQEVSCLNQALYDSIKNGSAYTLPIEFQVLSMDKEVDLTIDGLTRRPRSISNFPYTMSDIVFDQGLHQVFGRPDHKRKGSLREAVQKRRKLK